MKWTHARWVALVALLQFVPTSAIRAEWGDITFTRAADAAGSEYPPATFPHWVHRMQFRCYVCHEDIFTMKAGSNPITMEAISAGKYCGTCHNGKIAFSVVFESCQRCHR
jgi:c(7)-type cytochrome triheme protein